MAAAPSVSRSDVETTRDVAIMVVTFFIMAALTFVFAGNFLGFLPSGSTANNMYQEVLGNFSSFTGTAFQLTILYMIIAIVAIIAGYFVTRR
jgi:small-conductance mechanosensitive channel